MDSSSDGLGRRQYLSALAILAGTTSAGCLSLNQTGATDVVMYNMAADTISVSITITETDATEPVR